MSLIFSARIIAVLAAASAFPSIAVGCGGGDHPGNTGGGGGGTTTTGSGMGTGASDGGGGAAKNGDYFVATNGDDKNPGTLAAPFLTLDRARQAADALFAKAEPEGRTSPIVVMFRGGDYFVSPLAGGHGTQILTSEDSGSEKLGIVYRNYQDDIPVLSGGYRVSTWKNVGENRWEATLPAAAVNFENLWYNGVRRLRPRLGSGVLGTFQRVVAAVGKNGLQFDPSSGISSAWSNLVPASNNPCKQAAGDARRAGDIEVLYLELAGGSKLRVSCVDDANHIIYFTGETELAAVPGNRFMVENVQDQLTTAGQWFLDRSKTPWVLTYLAEAGEDPRTDTVIIPQNPLASPEVVVAHELHDVTFSGLQFSHDNYVVPDAGYTYTRLDLPVTSAVSCINCQRVTFSADTLAHTSGSGIDFTTCLAADTSMTPASPCPFGSSSGVSAHNTFENGVIFDVGAHGIRNGQLASPTDRDANLPQFLDVRSNLITGVGRVIPKAFPVAQGCGHDNTYENNEVTDSYSGGFNIGALNCPSAAGQNGSFGNVVANNLAHDLGQGISNDFGCVYFNVATPTFVPKNNQALANICHDINDGTASGDTTGFGGQGIYIDNFTGAVDVKDNLVYRTTDQPMNITSGPDVPNAPVTIENNIFAFGRARMIGIGLPWEKETCPAAPTLKFVAKHNIFYFDRKGPDFFVQGGCTYTCSSMVPGHGGDGFSAYELFSSNLYYRTDNMFDKDGEAFHVQKSIGQPGGQSPYCANGDSSGWAFMPFAMWEAQYDNGSIVADPGFVKASYPDDDYGFSGAAPAGFVPIDYSKIGRPKNAAKAGKVVATLPTAAFDPAQDF